MLCHSSFESVFSCQKNDISASDPPVWLKMAISVRFFFKRSIFSACVSRCITKLPTARAVFHVSLSLTVYEWYFLLWPNALSGSKSVFDRWSNGDWYVTNRSCWMRSRWPESSNSACILSSWVLWILITNVGPINLDAYNQAWKTKVFVTWLFPFPIYDCTTDYLYSCEHRVCSREREDMWLPKVYIKILLDFRDFCSCNLDL